MSRVRSGHASACAPARACRIPALDSLQPPPPPGDSTRSARAPSRSCRSPIRSDQAAGRRGGPPLRGELRRRAGSGLRPECRVHRRFRGARARAGGTGASRWAHPRRRGPGTGQGRDVQDGPRARTPRSRPDLPARGATRRRGGPDHLRDRREDSGNASAPKPGGPLPEHPRLPGPPESPSRRMKRPPPNTAPEATRIAAPEARGASRGSRQAAAMAASGCGGVDERAARAGFTASARQTRPTKPDTPVQRPQKAISGRSIAPSAPPASKIVAIEEGPVDRLVQPRDEGARVKSGSAARPDHVDGGRRASPAAGVVAGRVGRSASAIAPRAEQERGQRDKAAQACCPQVPGARGRRAAARITPAPVPEFMIPRTARCAAPRARTIETQSDGAGKTRPGLRPGQAPRRARTASPSASARSPLRRRAAATPSAIGIAVPSAPDAQAAATRREHVGGVGALCLRAPASLVPWRRSRDAREEQGRSRSARCPNDTPTSARPDAAGSRYRRGRRTFRVSASGHNNAV